MIDTEKMLDLKAVLLNDMNEENLFTFCAALLQARVIIPCEFVTDSFDIQKLLACKQGAVIEWKEPEYNPVPVEWDDKKWMRIYLEKSSMPEQYRRSCVHMNGRDAVELAKKQDGLEGMMLDPDGRILPLPLFYLSDVIEIIDNYEGEEK